MGDDLANNLSTSATSYNLVDKYNEYSIQIIRWILKTINVWPRPADASIAEKIRSDFATFTCYLLIIVILVPAALSLFIDEQESYEVRVQAFGPITFWFIAIVNYSCLLIHVDDIHDCVEHVRADWTIIKRFEDHRVMLRSAKIGRFIAGFCAVFMQGGIFTYNIVQGFTTCILHVENGSIVVRALPFPFYNKILNAHFSPAYEFVFFLQCLSSFVVNSVTVATCGLIAVFVMHACGQMKIMISWLENLIDDRDEERTSVTQRFAIIVNHHLRILSFVSRTEKIMNIICLMELIGCTMHMCILGYYCIMDFILGQHQNIVTHSMVLFSITFNIFIFCYIGELLSDQGEQIGKSAYMTNWYLLPGKTAQGFVLIILRSNATLKITAGKIVQLSFSTFSDVIKSAVAYLNLLRTVLVT
ncbi:PREDICTED: odorant receptor 82a-like [Wasmannia auropunctata]|uniref:odorant receptor 82a-like n=1 Tax=Wasmannia auropunctata TaxID=64793 RepID=UPI0005EDFCEF|nr:PREDICTED: odorant receptor 82a-like [Wasmannia auropunctata]